MPSRQLILASRSPRRQDLLIAAGLTPIVLPSDIDELTEHPVSPRELASDNAFLKTSALTKDHPGCVVLAADTIVVLHGEVFGKPTDLDIAHSMLSRLSGQTHEVITAVCIASSGMSSMVRFEEITRVRFRPLTDNDIQEYLRSINPLDKAGGYAAQEDEGRIIEQVEGSMSNVIGLPMKRTLAALHEHFPDVFE